MRVFVVVEKDVFVVPSGCAEDFCADATVCQMLNDFACRAAEFGVKVGIWNDRDQCSNRWLLLGCHGVLSSP